MKAFKRFDVTEEEILEIVKKTGYTSLSHSLGGGNTSVMTGMKIMANTHRFNVGFNGVGQSPSVDTQTGGSNTVYLKTKGYGQIEIDPRIYAYTGIWSHPGDKYGATQSVIGGNDHRTRSATVKEDRAISITEALTSGGVGETLAWTRIDLVRWGRRLKIPSEVFAKVKKALKDVKFGPDGKSFSEVAYK